MMENRLELSRRDALRLGLVAGVGMALGRMPLHGQVRAHLRRQERLNLITRKIPSTGEELPVVGVGTNRFGVSTAEEARPLCEVLQKLTELGGRVVDTARGYGRSEVVIGECVQQIGNRAELFLATKYSVGGRDEGADPKAGLEQAFERLQTDRIDLMMVHNLGGTETLLPLMRELKQAGRFRYIGVSTSSDRQYETLMGLMRNEGLDFVQVDYSIGNRNVAEQVLPLAQERGIGVLVNTPFGGRRATVLGEVAGQAVPEWAQEFDASTWPQIFLKYVVSHPAVTAVIPGTTKVEHAIDNHAASRGGLPDAAQRRRIEEFYDALPR